MNCHPSLSLKDQDNKLRVLLMGNPNVGKSVLFNQLTGLDVVTANFAGTTVTFNQGIIRYQSKQAVLTDVPGVYTLSASSVAEEVALSMLNEGADLIVCVLDATHLERNLHLALELKMHKIPILYVLNLSDIAKRRGLSVDVERLSMFLDAPVVETIAVKRFGISTLKETIFTEIPLPKIFKIEDKINLTQEITQQVLSKKPVKISFLERFGDWALHPISGLFIALIVLSLAVLIVVGGGEFIHEDILLPLFEKFYVPNVEGLIGRFVPDGYLYRILVGEYGVLIKMIEWPIVLIMPYVLLFFVVFSFLEDSGYLPRLGVLMDGMFKRLGLPGGQIVPFIMGYGCAVPAILGTRASGTSRERIIVVSMIAIAVPCAAQTGAFIMLLGSRSLLALAFVYMVSFMVMIIVGVSLNKLLKGRSRPMILEIPNFLIPSFKTMGKKIWIRMKHFLKEAQIPMAIGIVIAALVVETGGLIWLGNALEPLVTGWLNLPKEASLSLVLGIIRRELAVLPLLEMDLTTVQLITGSLVALFYLPCISVFFVLFREFKLKIALLITSSTFVLAFLLSGIIRHILDFFVAI